MTTVTDILGRPCTPEAALDIPATWGDGKYQDGGRLLPTCFQTVPPRTKEVLTDAIGRPPTDREWKDFSYQICDYFDDCGFGTFAVHVAIPPTPTIPVPAAGPMLALALIVAVLIRRWR